MKSNRKQSTARKTAILALKTGVLAFALLSVWFALGIVKNPSEWLLYVLAAAGHFFAACAFLWITRVLDPSWTFVQPRKTRRHR